LKALIYAEFLKLRKQGRVYYALAALLLIELVILSSAYFQGDSIIALLLTNLRQSFSFEGSLLNGNLVLYIILNTLWFNLPLINLIVVTGLLTSEYKDRTVQTNFLQPISKWKFILSKYIIAVLFTVLVVAFLGFSAGALSYSLFGKGDLIVYLENLNFFASDEAGKRIIFAFVAGGISMIFFSAVGLTLAVIFKDTVKTLITSSVFLILTNLLLKVDFKNTFVNRFFFPKLTDTWQLFFIYEIPWEIVIQNITLLLVYTALVVALGTYLFHKNDIE
jgi:ABC-2 type transport system permease protein